MKSVLELLKNFFIERIILYCVIFVFSFLVIVPLGDLKIRFTDGHCSRCLLYSSVRFNLNSSQTPQTCPTTITFGEQEVCEYSIAVSSVFCLIYPLVFAAVYVMMYRQDEAEAREESKLDLAHVLFLIHILVEVAVVILMLVSAGMITSGFRSLCNSINGFSSCREAQTADWCGYDGSNFYVSLSVTLAGSWCLFVFWFLQGLLGIWKLWRLNMLPVFSLPCLQRDE